jgi:hypothetical protein
MHGASLAWLKLACSLEETVRHGEPLLRLDDWDGEAILDMGNLEQQRQRLHERRTQLLDRLQSLAQRQDALLYDIDANQRRLGEFKVELSAKKRKLKE